MFTVEAFPAKHGDCLWIEYGDPGDPRRILIDAGPMETAEFLRAKLQGIPENDRKIELLIMSHIDDDHIAGVLDLSTEEGSSFKCGDVWFNGWHHIHDVPADFLGPEQGEKFSLQIRQRKWPWNKAFNHERICIETANNGPISLAGGMKLTILSPSLKQLAELKTAWESEILGKGKKPGWGEEAEIPKDLLGGISASKVRFWTTKDYDPDPSRANGSSIAIMAEYEGKKALFAADSHPDVLEHSISRLVDSGEKLRLDLFKVAHHGSKKNTSCSLMKLIDCDRFLISTSGTKHQHPHPETIAKLVAHRKQSKILYFNYRTEYNSGWDNTPLKKQFNFETVYDQNGFSKISL